MFRTRCIASATLPALVILLCSTPCTSASNSADDDEPVNAIWQVQRLDFNYRSANVYYRCEALQSKISEILRSVGAYRRVVVDMRCSSDRFVNNATARVTLAAPTEATFENVQAATTFDSRQQLVATLKKMRLPTAQSIERFPATWQTISLLSLDPGDCDLLRALHDQVFPLLSIRSTSGVPRCTSWATKMKPKVEVTALMRVPAADQMPSESRRED